MGYEYAGGCGVEGGRQLKPKDGAGPIWARYYSVTTQKPLFGDRDKTLHDNVNDLSLERRNGYAWFSNGEQKTIDAYPTWARANGVAPAEFDPFENAKIAACLPHPPTSFSSCFPAAPPSPST